MRVLDPHDGGSPAPRDGERDGEARARPAGGPADRDEAALGALVERAAARDAAAEAELDERWRPFVRRRLAEARSRRNWFWLNDLDGAVQEVLVQFFRALVEGKFRFEGRARLEGFLVRTAFFVAMNLKDREVREMAVSLHDEEGGLRFDLGDFAEAAYDGLERRECLKLLARALAELNPNRRDVVERTLLGQKVRQICEETERSAASVSGLKFNALVELRGRLTALGFLERCGALFSLDAEDVGD